MADTIFRQSALDRMSNPEQLDAAPRIVRRSHWLVVAAVAGSIVFALAWAIVVQAPLKVAASGILIDREGLVEVVADEEGKLQAIAVAPGDLVVAGQPIATLARSELGRKLTEARTALQDAEERLGRLRAFYALEAQRRGGADAQRLGTVAQTRAALDAQLKALRGKEARILALVERGFIRRDDLLATQIAIADTRERIAKLGETATDVRVEAIEREGQTGIALLDAEKAVDERRRALGEIESRLSEQQTIRAQTSGRVVEVKVNGGDVVGAGSAIATLAPTGHNSETVALLYVPAGQGKRIRAGMEAEIVPSTVERSLYGHIRGRVASVAPLPATAAGMRRILRNDQLVEQLLAAGAPIEVRVTLERDPATRTGLAWSASKGPVGGVSVGTLVAGRVIVDHVPVIGWLVPGLRRADS